MQCVKCPTEFVPVYSDNRYRFSYCLKCNQKYVAEKELKEKQELAKKLKKQKERDERLKKQYEFNLTTCNSCGKEEERGR